MAKLKEYKLKPMDFFGHGEWEQVVILTVEKRYLFGMFKRLINIEHTISMYGDLGAYYKYWDDLIDNEKQIEL